MDIKIPEIIGEFKACYKDQFSLEMAVYSQLRGSHNKELRKQIALYLGINDKRPPDVVTLADLLRLHFDQIRLF